MKNLISFLFILLTLNSFGQLPANSIQVEISETVNLKVTEYVYEISNEKLSSTSPFDFDFSDAYDDDDDEYDEDYENEITKPVPLTIPQISKALQGAKFQGTVVSKAKYDVKAGQDADEAKFDNQVIQVRVTSLDELKRLSKFVVDLKVAYGELTEVNFEEINNQYEVLYPKMMEAAKKKASLMASTSGKKVGNVIQIAEGVSGQSLFGDAMDEYMKSTMEVTSSLWKKEIPTSKTKVVTLSYVFELN